jgi:hypothetical protein
MRASWDFRTAICVAGTLCLALAGCISHDQVHLPNPAPCRITCEHDWVPPLDPVCYGYHPTCWRPWNAGCPACPPPSSAVTHGVIEGWPPIESFPQPESLPPGPLLDRPRLDLPERNVPTDALPPAIEHNAPFEHNAPQQGSSRSTLYLRADSAPDSVPDFGPTLEEAKSSIDEHLTQYLRDGGVSFDVWPESLWDQNRRQAFILDKPQQQDSSVRRASYP